MLVALDLETSDSRGASFEIFRDDFKVDSMSLFYGNGIQWYSDKPLDILDKLRELSEMQTGIVVHNKQFEYSVLTKLYPEYPLNYVQDTMRMAQLWDAGGAEFDMEPTLTLEQSIALELGEISEDDLDKHWKKSKGLSLEACALRFLPSEYHHHKAVAHNWLKENHGIKSNYGQHLHLLPPDVLEAYNNKDTEVTYRLYEALKTLLGDFDYTRDWQLYTLRIRHMAAAYIDGIHINRPVLLEYIKEIEAEISGIESRFLERFKTEIETVQELRLVRLVNDWALDSELKSDRARANRFEAVASGKHDDKWERFNVGSSHHLVLLFCEVLKIVPKFLTPKGSPSCKSSHLNQYGEGGEMLLKRKKRLLVLQQACNVYLGSAVDGKVHPQIRAAGTRTGRVAGGSL